MGTLVKPHGSDVLKPLYVEDATQRAALEKEAAGLPKPTKSVPYSIALLLAVIVEGIHRLPFVKKPPPMSRYGVAIMGRDLTFSCDKAKRMLGYHPTTTIEQGMAGLSAWIREIGGVEKVIG